MRLWIRGALAAGLLALAGLCAAQTPEAPVAPVGKPAIGKPVRDRDFGVTTRQPGLQRRVEMFQWQATDSGYARAWSERLIDSSGFAPGHENPAEFPLPTRYWIAPRVMLDGKPVDEDVLKELGRWHGFRPGFTALPENLAATFQPEGDGLGSAENPLAPETGDLRVTWRELRLPDLANKVALEEGRWVLRPDAAVADAEAADAKTPVAAAPPAWRRVWPFAAAGIVLLLVLVRLRRRVRRPA